MNCQPAGARCARPGDCHGVAAPAAAAASAAALPVRCLLPACCLLWPLRCPSLSGNSVQLLLSSQVTDHEH